MIIFNTNHFDDIQQLKEVGSHTEARVRIATIIDDPGLAGVYQEIVGIQARIGYLPVTAKAVRDDMDEKLKASLKLRVFNADAVIDLL